MEVPNERIPTKREMDKKLAMDTARPTLGQVGRVLGCSARHVGALMAAGHLTKGADICRLVKEWVEYQMGLAAAGRRRG